MESSALDLLCNPLHCANNIMHPFVTPSIVRKVKGAISMQASFTVRAGYTGKQGHVISLQNFTSLKVG